MSRRWKPSSDWLAIKTIDAHAAGEPLRLIISGLPPIRGKTILEKRRYAQEHLDDLRRALMWEPRGHADMYGCILTKPVSPGSHIGVLFLHNEGFSTMCGHGIIALTKIVLETGLAQIEGDRPVLRIDTPAGLVIASAHRERGWISDISFLNVPSFVYAMDREVDIPGLGNVRYDVAFGGAFYAFCKAEDLGCRLVPDDFRLLIDVGMKVKSAVMMSLPVKHPISDDLSFLYGTIIVGKPHDPRHHSRNVCIFAEGEVDRSPTGTGVSARAALLYARGELKKDETFTVESILGTCFSGRVAEVGRFGPYECVTPEVTGNAYIIGRHEFLLDPKDPLRSGFILR